MSIETETSIPQEKDKRSEKEFQKILKNLVDKDVQKHSKPLWIGQQFIHRPYIVLAIWFIIFAVALVLSISFDVFKKSEQNRREYLIWSHERVKAMDMQVQMQEDFQKGLGSVQIPERSQQEDNWSTNIILSCGSEDCNLFSKEGLKVLYHFEQQITNHKEYENVCLGSVESPACSENSLLSISFIVQKVLNKKPDQLTDNDVELLGNAIFEGDELSLFSQIKFYFDKNFTEINRKAKNLRSYMKFGAPLRLNGQLKKDKFEDREDQKEKLNDFQREIIEIRDNNDLMISEDMSFNTYSDRMALIEFQTTVDKDTLWAAASVLFVFVYVSIHLRSLFLGGIVMIQIIFSFPLTMCLFNLVFGITFFSSLHVCAISIVLGISADDIFVFVDAWEQTALYDQLDKDPIKRLNQRMAITYRRAARAMFTTSSTTSAAFIATGFSNIMPISSFGFFSGIIIPVNFILVILCFPAVLMIYETKLKDNKCCCCLKKKNKNKIIQENEIQQNQQQQQQLQQQQKEQEQEGQDMNEQKLHFIEKFFANTFTQFTNKFKYPIIFVFLIWAVISSIYALKISPLSEPEKLLPDDHKAMVAKYKALYQFHQSGSADTGITLYQFWGVDDLDSSENSRWDVEALGKIEWDESFDLSPEKNQQFFLDYCQNLKNNELVQDKRVDSFIFDFKSFAETETLERQFPVKQEKFFSYLKLFTETQVGYTHFNNNRIGIIDNKLHYIQIKISSIGTPFKPYDELNPLYEKWDSLITETNQKAPKGLQNSKQSGGIHWTWMITERAFVSNAVQGMLISLVFGLIVLVLTTQNIFVALFSLLSIIGIVISVVCVMQWSGWELGIAESITIVIVIGLSIDYVVHLANHYVESVYPDRHRKIKVALRDLGISILSGGLTTAGAGFFLFFADMILFNKFGTLIISTVFFSLAYSLLFFSAIMHAFGPENETGSLTKLCKKYKSIEQKEAKVSSLEQVCENKQQGNLNTEQQDLVVEVEQSTPHIKEQQGTDIKIDIPQSTEPENFIDTEEPCITEKMDQYQIPEK